MRFAEPVPVDFDKTRQLLRTFFLEQAVASGNHGLREVADAIAGVPDGDLILGTLGVHLTLTPDGADILTNETLIDLARSYEPGRHADPIIWLGGWSKALIDQWVQQPRQV